MIFAPFLFLLLGIAGSLAWAMRDHQLMAPAVGTADGTAFLRRSSVRVGTPAAWRALLPLVRVETVRLVRHPAPYLFLVPTTGLWLMNFTYSSVVNRATEDADVVVGVVGYAWGVLIASNLLTLRSRRWRSEELLASVPVPERSRTVAHLVATLVAVPGSVLIIVTWYLVGSWTGRGIGTPRLAVLATGPLIVIGAGCVGVAVARWLPRPVFGWVAVIATFVLQVNFGQGDPRWRWLHFSSYSGESVHYPELAPDLWSIHLVYLVGGILLVGAVALARDGIDLRNGALLAGALVLLATTGLLQVRPLPDADALTYARRLEDPAWNQHCQRAGRATFCADADHADLVPSWRAPVDGVLDELPPGSSGATVTLRQRPLIDASVEVPHPVAIHADPSRVWPDDDEVSLSHAWSLPASGDSGAPGSAQLSLAFRVASRAVGLPPDAWWSATAPGAASWPEVKLVGSDQREPIPGPIVQCDAGGQGRAVAAVWLAGQSTPAARAELQRRAGEILAKRQQDAVIALDVVGTYEARLPDPMPEQGALVRGSDVIAAVALLDRDDAQVAAVLHEHWAEVVGRPDRTPEATRTGAVLQWFGLDPVAAERAVASTAPPFDIEADHNGGEGHITNVALASGPCPSGRR